MKLLYVFLFISISCLQKQNDDFDKMITDLGNLEKYIKEYISEKSYTEKNSYPFNCLLYKIRSIFDIRMDNSRREFTR